MSTIVEKINIGEQNKNAGNELFKSNDLKGALLKYHTAILYLKGLDNSQFSAFKMGSTGQQNDEMQQDEKAKCASLLTAIHANMAAVYLKEGQADKAVKSANLALALAPDHAKSMFRLGCAYKLQGKMEKAVDVLVKAAKLAPNDIGIRQELDTIKAFLKQKDRESAEELKKNLVK